MVRNDFFFGRYAFILPGSIIRWLFFTIVNLFTNGKVYGYLNYLRPKEVNKDKYVKMASSNWNFVTGICFYLSFVIFLC